MRISWVLLAENVVMNEHSQRMDILGEFRRVIADEFPYSLPKFHIICRAEVDASELVTLPYKLTLRTPSEELIELHSSDASVTIPPNVGHVVGNLISEIRDLEFASKGRYAITAQLGDSEYSADIVVLPRRNVKDDAQK